MSVLRF